MFLREISERQGKAEGGEAVAASPGGVRRGLMAIQAVGPTDDLPHEGEVPRGHVEILAIARQCARLREDRNVHEDRIAPSAVERHELAQGAVLREAAVRRAQHECAGARITGALRELVEQQVRRQRTLRWHCERVSRAVQVRFCEAHHLCRVAEAQLGDQRASTSSVAA